MENTRMTVIHFNYAKFGLAYVFLEPLGWCRCYHDVDIRATKKTEKENEIHHFPETFVCAG